MCEITGMLEAYSDSLVRKRKEERKNQYMTRRNSYCGTFCYWKNFARRKRKTKKTKDMKYRTRNPKGSSKEKYYERQGI